MALLRPLYRDDRIALYPVIAVTKIVLLSSLGLQ